MRSSEPRSAGRGANPGAACGARAVRSTRALAPRAVLLLALAAAAVAAVPAPRAAAQESTLELASSALYSGIFDFEPFGNNAFCGVPEGFLIVQLTNGVPSGIREFMLSPDSTVTAFTFNDAKAYVTTGAGGVSIVNPFAAGQLAPAVTIRPLGSAFGGAIGSDSLVYATEGGSLLTFVLGAGDEIRLVSDWPVPVDAGEVIAAGSRLLVFGAGGAVAITLGATRVPVRSDTLLASGTVLAAAGTDNAIYVATANALLIPFVAQPGGGFREGVRTPLRGRAADLSVSANLAAVATDSGFAVYEGSQPEAPVLALDRFDGDGVGSLAFRGEELLVSRSETGFESYSVFIGSESTPTDVQRDLGTLSTLALDGDYLYATSPDSGLYRFSTTAGPVLTERRLLFARRFFGAVAARDTLIVLADEGQGARCYTGVVGSGGVTARGLFRFSGLIFNMQFQDSLLLFAGGAAGFRVASINAPDAPFGLVAYDPPPTFGSYRAEFAADRLVYSAARFPVALHIVDIATLGAPAAVDTISFTGSIDFAVDRDSRRMVVLHGAEGAQRLTLYDISAPRSPVALDTVSVAGGAGGALAIRGDLVLVGNAGASGTQRYVIENGSRLTAAGESRTAGAPVQIAIGPEATYVAEGADGIETFVNFSATSIVLRGRLELPGSLLLTAVADSTIVAADNRQVLHSLLLDRNGLLQTRDTFDTGGRVRALTFVGGKSRIATVVADSLRLFDVNSFGDLIRVRSDTGVRFTGAPATSIVPFGANVLVSTGPLVNVVSIATPTSPRVVTTFSGVGQSGVSEAGPIRTLVVRDNILFVVYRGVVSAVPSQSRPPLVTAWSLGATAVNPQYLGSYFDATEREYLDAAISGTLLYLAVGEEGVKVLDVSTPENLAFVQRVVESANTEALAIDGDLLILGNGADGVAVNNLLVSEIDPPRVSSADTPGIARDVAGLPGRVLVSDTFALLAYKASVALSDTTAPSFFIGFVPNPFISAYADLFVIPSEPVSEDPLINYRIEDLDVGLAVNLVDVEERVYQSSLLLDRIGTGELTVTGIDRSANEGLSAKTIVLDLLRGAFGGTISSGDGQLQVAVAPGAFAGDARFIAMPYSAEDAGTRYGDAALPDGAVASGYRVAIVPGNDMPIEVRLREPRRDTAGAATIHRARPWQVYRSDGAAWRALESVSQDGWVSAASDGGGLFWLAPGESSTGGLLPRVAMLYGNAPNPFNPVTTIRYDVPVPGNRVLLELYSPEGRLVRRLAEGFHPAGRYESVWDGVGGDGAPAASGIYLLRYATGDVSLTRKLTLLR